MSHPCITGVRPVARAALKFSAAAAESKASRPARCRVVLRITSWSLFMHRTTFAASLAFALAFATPAHAESNATKDEAMAMVKKGVAFIRANGKDKGYAEISAKGSKFSDRDLYLVVYGLDGVVYAHGANEKMIGKNLIDLKDVDGKPFVKERVELAQSKGTFWQDYKFTNPVSKKIEPKQMYCEKLDDVAVCGGIYK
jgi:cytochrome c